MVRENERIKMDKRNQIESVLFGFVVGDCLGVPVEFKRRGTYKVNDMIGYGTYNQPSGTWSDDTSLTLCLSENLVEGGDASSLMEKFVRYQEVGYLTPFGKMFDIGITTVEAVERFKTGIPAEKCGGTGERENGNGALMRIAPLLFYLQKENEFEKRVAVVKAYSEITHAHPRSIVASLIYSELLRNIRFGLSIRQSLSGIQQLFSTYFDSEHEYKKELVHFSRIFQENFCTIPENQIRSSGYVVDSLEAAIWCLEITDSYKDAVLTAVNLGEDTDTVGAITGSLAGLYYSFQSIPEEWIEAIQNKVLLDACIRRFVEWNK